MTYPPTTVTIPITPRFGCYLLSKNRKVIYVGRSDEILRRLAGQIYGRFSGLYDEIELLICPTSEAAVELEKELIEAHKPKFNKSDNPFYEYPTSTQPGKRYAHLLAE